MSARPSIPTATCPAPCWPAPRWPVSTSSSCRSCGSACSVPSRSARICPRARADVRAAARQLRQGGGDLVHHAQHVPRHACSLWPAPRARCRSSAKTGCCRVSWRWRIEPTDCPWAATLSHRRHGDHLPACRRSGLDDRRRQLHLSHRHLHAQRGCLAAAPGSARRRAALSCAARHHHAWRCRRRDLAARRHSRLPAIRPADGVVRPGLGLFRRRLFTLGASIEDRLRAGLPVVARRRCTSS